MISGAWPVAPSDTSKTICVVRALPRKDQETAMSVLIVTQISKRVAVVFLTAATFLTLGATSL